MAFAHNPALERAILDDPGNEDAYLVYGDWLQDHGDPRGELAIIEHAASRAPEDHDLARRRELVRREILADLFHPLVFDSVLGLRWRLGFIDAITIDVTQCYRAELWPPDVLTRLGDHPVSRLLSALTVEHFHGAGWPALRRSGMEFIEPLLTVLQPERRSGRLPGLRRLALRGATNGTLFESADQVARLAGLAIRDLAISCAQFPEGGILALQQEQGTLEELELDLHGWSRENWQALVAGTWSRLERLVVTVPEDGMRLPRELLSGARFPSLRHLGIMAAPHTDAIVDELLASPLASQLHSLDASFERISDQGQAMLCASPDAARSLELFPTAGLTFRWWNDRDEHVHVRFIGFMERLGRLDQALALYERAIAHDPHRALAWLGKARVLARVGRAREAAMCYREAAIIDPAHQPSL